jgi:site-specific recombinase XerD/CHAT domain-containing protein
VNYLDFVLEIGTSPDSFYPVYVISSPAGEARQFMKFPFNEQQLENQLQALHQALIRSNSSLRKNISPEEQTVQKFGLALFDALFTGEVKNLYDVSQLEASHQGKGLRLKLRIQPPEIASLPWEFLYDKRHDTYICLSNNTPIIRYLDMSRPIQPLTVSLPISILGMIANPKDLPELDIEREKQRIEKSLEVLRFNGQVELTWLPGRTCHDLQRAMRSGTWHIFHFIGHGGFNVEEDEGLISLENDKGYTDNLSATKLGDLLKDHRFLRLAVLNSCDGARGSKYDIFSSTSAILIRRGIPAVLAMQYEITDTAAIELSRTFYEVLAEGLPVDTAVAEARKAINIGRRNTLEWGTPVLYMRSPDGVLFDLHLKRYNDNISTAIITPTFSAPPKEEQISQWIKSKRSKRTRKQYEAIMPFRQLLLKSKLDLDSEDVIRISSLAEDWAYGKKGGEIAGTTFNNRLSILSSFYIFAMERKWVKSNPIKLIERREERNINAAEAIEVEKVKNALKSIDRSRPEGKRDYAILCLLLTTGRHVSEVVELRCGAITRGKNGMTITFKLIRSGEVLAVPLSPGVAKSLNEYISSAYPNSFAVDSPLWPSLSKNKTKGKPIGTQAVAKVCNKYLGTTKVEATKRTYDSIRYKFGIEGIEKKLGIN